MEIWELIKESNLFNFGIFLLIIIVIAKKVDISAMLEKAKAEIIKNIETSKSVKADADKELQNAQKSAVDVDQEVLEISRITEKNAENLKSHMIEDAKSKATLMRENAEKIIQIEEKNLSNLLISKHSAKSLELAKEHIEKTLKNNPELQRKFIEYSLNDLEEVWK